MPIELSDTKCTKIFLHSSLPFVARKLLCRIIQIYIYLNENDEMSDEFFFFAAF